MTNIITKLKMIWNIIMGRGVMYKILVDNGVIDVMNPKVMLVENCIINDEGI